MDNITNEEKVQKKPTFLEKNSPLRAIRAKCLDCCGGYPKEVRFCPVENCPLYFFRNGHRPKQKKLV